jgi:acetyl esterase/lipase
VLDGIEAEGEDLSVSSAPCAMLLFNPVIDTTKHGYGSGKLPGCAEALSPTQHVKPGIPPTIIFHGTADPTVPFENVERFTARMTAAGNRCELVPFEGKKHGFFNYGRDEDSFDQTMVAADAFLVSLGLLQEPGQ